MLDEEHSAILSTFINIPFANKIFLFCLFLSGRFTQVLLYIMNPYFYQTIVGILTFCEQYKFHAQLS